MKILVLNCGSSSLKFQLIETGAEQIRNNQDRVLAHGVVERIGSSDAKTTFEVPGSDRVQETREILQHKDAIEAAFTFLRGEIKVIGDLQEIEGVGHRIVHGGERFQASTLIDDDVIKQIEALSDLAPLHNPHNLKGYYASKALLPHAAQAAVFDTAFHQTLPPHAYLYGLPYIYYTRDKLRRYGFHGTSHRFVSYRYAQIQSRPLADFKLITCHLGNGCSACAIDRGRSIDTSMGFTPLEGLIMGTRPGDLDPGAVLYMVNRAEMGMHEMEVTLNTHSGLYGISGVSGDMRDLLSQEQGNGRAKTAVDAFCYRVAKYIGSYFVALGGADAIVFAGGIGENAAPVRARICERLTAVGVEIDSMRNEASNGKEAEISTDGSRVEAWVIPTNEELLIARDTARLMLGISQD
jgi:acetate kinase